MIKLLAISSDGNVRDLAFSTKSETSLEIFHNPFSFRSLRTGTTNPWVLSDKSAQASEALERGFYEAIRERHSVRAASRLSLKVLRFKRDLFEFNRL